LEGAFLFLLFVVIYYLLLAIFDFDSLIGVACEVTEEGMIVIIYALADALEHRVRGFGFQTFIVFVSLIIKES